MLFVSYVDKGSQSACVKDTEDGVVETYAFADLIDIVQSHNIPVKGVSLDFGQPKIEAVADPIVVLREGMALQFRGSQGVWTESCNVAMVSGLGAWVQIDETSKQYDKSQLPSANMRITDETKAKLQSVLKYIQSQLGYSYQVQILSNCNIIFKFKG